MASSERWPPPRARRRLAVAPTAIRTCPLCEATCGLIALYGFAVRDVANCSPPVLDRPQGMPVQATEDVMPGVVTIPHGWGHDTPGAMLGVASAQPGVNSNATGCRR